MAINLEKFDKLKERVATGKDFLKIFEYFLDRFAEDDKFMRLGRKAKNAKLEGFIAGIAESVLKVKSPRIATMFIEIPEAHFTHGGCDINGRPASVLYFDDIDVGLLVFLPTKPGEPNLFSRFSCQTVPPDYIGSDN